MDIDYEALKSQTHDALKALIKEYSPQCRINSAPQDNSFKLLFICEETDVRFYIADVYVAEYDSDHSSHIRVIPGSAAKPKCFSKAGVEFRDFVNMQISWGMASFENDVRRQKRKKEKQKLLIDAIKKLSEAHGVEIHFNTVSEEAYILLNDVKGVPHKFTVNVEKELVTIGATSFAGTPPNFPMHVPLHVFVNFKNEMALTNLLTN